MKKLTFYRQQTDYTCGLACMRMILSSKNIYKTEEELKKLLLYPKYPGPTPHKGFTNICKKMKFDCLELENSSIKKIKELLKKDFNVIVSRYIPSQKVDHYAIVKKIDKENIYFLDPWFGKNHKYTLKYFEKKWFDLENKKRWLIAIK